MRMMGGETAFKIFRLRRDLQGRPNLVFVCYLDDSDSFTGPTLGIAGYLAHLEGWVAFEAEVEPFLREWGVDVLTGKDFQGGRHSFKGWDGARKAEFVNGLYAIAKKYVILGVNSVVDKEYYKSIRDKFPEFKNTSPLCAAFNSAVINTLTKDFLGTMWGFGFDVSFMVELGNKNSGNLERYFKWLKAQPGVGERLGSISLVGKRDCRAIQLADFLAFHGRREADGWARSSFTERESQGHAMKIMTSHVPHRHNRFYDNGGAGHWMASIFGPEDSNVLALPLGGLK